MELEVNQRDQFILAVENMALEILDISLSFYEFYSFTAIAVASSVVACVRKLIGIKKVWPEWI